jgi:hypothetical protein
MRLTPDIVRDLDIARVAVDRIRKHLIDVAAAVAAAPPQELANTLVEGAVFGDASPTLDPKLRALADELTKAIYLYHAYVGTLTGRGRQLLEAARRTASDESPDPSRM